MPWNVEANAPLARLLYRRCIIARKPSVQTVAARTGIPESTLKDWCHGSSQIPLWALPVLASVVDDPVFFADLSQAAHVGLLVLPLPRPEGQGDNLRTTALRIAGETGRVGVVVDSSLQGDGEIDTAELAAIETDIDAAQRLLEQLRAEARAAHARGRAG